MKAQVSAFIILGLAMLFAAFLLFFITLYSTSTTPFIEGTPPFYVQSCLETALKQSILEYGAFGPNNNPKYKNITFGYNDSILLQSESEMLKTITETTKMKADDCTHSGQESNKFATSGNALLTLSIKENKITASYQQRIEYNTAQQTATRTQFRYELPTRFLQTFRLLHKRVEDYQQTHLVRSIRTMQQLNQGNYSISYIPDNNHIILEIIDKQDTFNTEPFRFYTILVN